MPKHTHTVPELWAIDCSFKNASQHSLFCSSCRTASIFIISPMHLTFCLHASNTNCVRFHLTLKLCNVDRSFQRTKFAELQP